MDTSEITALEKLETRIVEVVEQLRSVRELNKEAEQEIERLRGELEEKEREAAQLKAMTSGVDTQRDEVKSRIESLLEKLEGLEA